MRNTGKCGLLLRMDIDALIARVGGAAVVARMCGITSQAVSQWTRVPVQRCLAIERATHGTVTRSDLRPDIWPATEAKRHVA